MILLAANNAKTVLASGINASATSLTVASGKGAYFPTPVSGTSAFLLTLTDAATETQTEIVLVTAVSGDAFTITRAQEGTTALAWSVNDIAMNTVTAGTLSNYYAQLDSPTFINVPAAPTAAAGSNTTQLANMAALYAATVGFGLGASTSPVITDLGAVTNTGIYAFASTATSAPVALSGELLHLQYNSSNGAQLVVITGSTLPRTFTRTMQSGTWTAWQELATLASPAFTGTPTAPTASFGANTTQLATMAAVYAATQAFGLGTNSIAVSPLSNAVATGFYRYVASVSDAPTTSAGTLLHLQVSSTYATQLAATTTGTTNRTFTRTLNNGTWGGWQELATLASPTFTGTPAAPTATAGTNTTQLATTAFVTTGIANAAYGRYLRTIQITASGPYTPSSDAKSGVVETVGAGGGGGGCAATTTTTAHLVSGGGGAGGTAMHRLTSLDTSYTVTIGAGGAGGAGANVGTGGGTTSFANASGTTLCSASGGGGGGAGVSGSVSNSNALVASGGPAGSGITGNLRTGSYESASVAVAAYSSNIGSGGGSTPYGTGGARVGVSVQGAVAGNNGTGYGTGGGGCAAYSASAVTAALTGGAGTAGIVLVHEFG